MKEFVDVRDFLVGIDIVGDWDGEEEEVVERINEMVYRAYELLPDYASPLMAEKLFDELWEAVAGQEFILENELDELESWVTSFVQQKLDEIEND